MSSTPWSPAPRSTGSRPDTTLDELRDLMARAHTRYPVIDDEDTPVGVVHLADVLAH